MSKANRKREFLKRKAKQANDDNNEEEITPQIFMDSLTEDERLLVCSFLPFSLFFLLIFNFSQRLEMKFKLIWNYSIPKK